jgi:hypothetical protein
LAGVKIGCTEAETRDQRRKKDRAERRGTEELEELWELRPANGSETNKADGVIFWSFIVFSAIL